MSFLKKLGRAVLNTLTIIAGVGPVLAASIPGTRDDKIIAKVTDALGLVHQQVVAVEIFAGALADTGKQLTGPEKLAMAAPLVERIIINSELLAGREIADEARFSAAVKAFAGAWADILNSLKDKGIEIKKA
jgi:hypothetical protein